MSVFDNLRESLQAVLDDAGDGWQLAHYTVILGIQQMDSGGRVSSAAWMLSPIDQPGYVTEGLLTSASDMMAGADIEDD